VPVVRMREPELAAKFLPVLAAVLRRLTGALTTAEWFEPGAITEVQEDSPVKALGYHAGT